MSGTIFIDGGSPRGLPAAGGVSSADGIIVAQGGTPGVPGTATIREATVAQLIASASFLPTSGGAITGNLTVNGTTTLTGIPTGPTAVPGTNTTQLATTAFDTAAILVETNRATAVEALLAPKASPTLTGVPTAPTAALGTNTTQLATTAFTGAAIAAAIFSPAAAPGVLFGLTLSNDSVTPNTILDISAGTCTDSTNSHAIGLGAFTKSIAGSWAAGSGANGMGIGLTATASTWYHVFAIIVSGTPDVYFDTSVTAVNKPASTTAFRRIGSIKLDGAVHILAFSQNGDEFLWGAPPADLAAGLLGTTPFTLSLSVPPGVKVNALVLGNITNASTTAGMLINSLDQPAIAGGALVSNYTAIVPVVGAPVAWGQINIRTNTSGAIRLVANAANTTTNLYTVGWIDTRGRLN